MSSYAWIITRDYVTTADDCKRYAESAGKDGLPDRTGVTGRHDATGEQAASWLGNLAARGLTLRRRLVGAIERNRHARSRLLGCRELPVKDGSVQPLDVTGDRSGNRL